MLLCDSIIAGYFDGKSGVAAINAITPITGFVTFFGDLCSTGVGIVFTREVGAMRKKRADEIYSQGLIISLSIGLLSALGAYGLCSDWICFKELRRSGAYYSCRGRQPDIAPPIKACQKDEGREEINQGRKPQEYWSVGQPLCQLTLTPPPRGRSRTPRAFAFLSKFKIW